MRCPAVGWRDITYGRPRQEHGAEMKKIMIAATDVSLGVATDLSTFSIVGRIVEQSHQGPQRTEDEVHLTLTIRQAMRLLAMLQAVQTKYGLPAHTDPVSETIVPPAKDRN